MLKSHHDVAVGRAYRDEQTVFVADVDFVQPPQGRARLTPSVVWLQTFDESLRRRFGPLYLFEKPGPQFLNLQPNWELRRAMGTAACRDNQIVDQQI